MKSDLNAVADGKNRSVRCVSYGVDDGLLSVEGNGGNLPNSCRTRDGRIWFPTIHGVAIIDPQQVSHDELPTPVVIEEVRTQGEVVFNNEPDFSELSSESRGVSASPHAKQSFTSPAFAELQLPPGHGRSLSIHYTANGFAFAKRIRFRYRIERRGRESPWLEGGTDRFQHFQDLSPGHYRFQVIAGNSHGVWNPTGASLAFFIAPHFYETWTFYGTCGLALFTMVGSLELFRRRLYHRITALQQAAALANERERIARDLHDDVGGSLAQIALKSEIMCTRTGQSQDTTQEFQKMSSLARSALENMGQIIWSNNPKFDTLSGLSAYIREFASNHFTEEVHFTFEATTLDDAEIHLTSDFRRNIFYTVKEALNNIAKHARAKSVSLRMLKNDGGLQIEVLDDGVGFGAHTGSVSGTGLDSMKKRIAQLRGQIHIHSEPGSETRIAMRVPFD